MFLFKSVKSRWINLVLLFAILGSVFGGSRSNQFNAARAGDAPQGSFWVNYAFTPDFPTTWQAPVEAYLLDKLSLPAGHYEYVLSAYRFSQDGRWADVVAVPRSLVEARWESQDAEIHEILIEQIAEEEFFWTSVAFQGDPNLLRQAPADLGDYSFFYAPQPLAPQGMEFKFPWIENLTWTLTQTWHEGNSLDFAPPATNPATNHAVLAAEAGYVSLVCGAPADKDESILRITHADNSYTQYTHLSSNGLENGVINNHIRRGQRLGVLYANSGKFNTPCGYGEGIHLHFKLSSRDLVIQGLKAEDIAKGDSFTSSNDPGEDIQVTSCEGGDGVILYSENNYKGFCVRLSADTSDLGTTSLGRNQVESLKILGNFKATLYNDAGFGGDSSAFTTDDSDLSDNKIGTNRASAVRVSRRDAGGSSNCDGGPGVYLYTGKNYSSNCMKITGEEKDLNRTFIGENSISSVRIAGDYKAQIYSKKRFAGDKTTLTASDPDLSDNKVGNDTASSIKVTRMTLQVSSNCDGAPGVYLYAEPNYTGNCSKFTSDSPNPGGWFVGNDSAGSLQIIGEFQADACRNDNFQGVCSHFEQSDPDLTDNEVKSDTISSLRVSTSASAQAVNCLPGQFSAEFFNNTNLQGGPALRRCDNQVNFNWLFTSPALVISWDHFSARWTGDIVVGASGYYWINTTTDDGVRLYLDDILVINRWSDMAETTIGVKRYLAAGSHRIRMEYYEKSGFATARFNWGYASLTDESSDSMREMELGDGLNGDISTGGEVDEYYFDGAAGQAVNIRMEQMESSLDSVLALYNQEGQLIGQADDNNGGLDGFLSLNLPENGRYTLTARGYGGSNGAYRILLEAESLTDGDDGRWVALGSDANGMIGVTSDRDYYYLSAVKNRALLIGVQAARQDLDSVLELFDQAGNRVARNDDGGGGRNPLLVYIAPESGTYRLAVRSFNLASSGSYTITVYQSVNRTGNLAQNKPAAASSFSNLSASAVAALDGSLDSAWMPANVGDQYLYADLGSNPSYDQVVLKWGDVFPASYGVITWTGGGWKVMYWTELGDGGTDIIPLEPLNACCIGVYIPAAANPAGISLRELEVYDTSQIIIPLIPPDPGDKGIEIVTTEIPPALVEPGKTLVMMGSGEQAQETIPLSSPVPAINSVNFEAGRPVVSLLYPQAAGKVYWTGETVLLQSAAEDTDRNGEGITTYEWQSDLQGYLGSEPVMQTLLSAGSHNISVRARDDEGVWSDWAVTRIQVYALIQRVFLPMIKR